MANYETSSIKSVAYLAKTNLNKRNLIRFVNYCLRSNQSENSWIFVRKTFQFLCNKSKITKSELRKFSDQFDKIKANEHEYIRKIKTGMRRENCEEVEIGWYKSNDFMGYTGVVLSFNGNKIFVIDFDVFADDAQEELSSITEQEKVPMGCYNCSNVKFESTLAKLNKIDLINFVPEFCLPYGKSYQENQNCWTFVLDAFHYLNSEGKVIQERMKTFISQLRKLIAINKKKVI